MEKIELESRFREVDHEAACKQVSQAAQLGNDTVSDRLFRLLMLAAVVVVLLVASSDINRFVRLGAVGSFFVGAALFFQRIQSSRQHKTKFSKLREGKEKIILNEEGYRIEHPGHEGIVRWSHVEGVLLTKDAILILNSEYEYYPIEAKAFISAEEMKATAEQIQKWIDVSSQR